MAQLPCLQVHMFLDVQRHHRDTTIDKEILREFAHKFKTADWPGGRLPEVCYDPRSLEAGTAKRSSLHAKCIVIHRKLAFVFSANFTEAAHLRNVEVGALIQSERFAARLVEHFEALVAPGVLRVLVFSRGCRLPPVSEPVPEAYPVPPPEPNVTLESR